MKPLPYPTARRHQRGASLVEATLVLAVAAVLAGAALPGWHEARERRQLDAASAQLATDLHLARSLAVSQAEGVRLGFTPGQACYVVHTGAAGDCHCAVDGSARCSGSAQPLRVATLPGDGAVSIEANVRSMRFDAGRGTVTPTATIRLTNAGGAEVRHVVNIMGRARTCSPEGRVAGHPRC